MTNATAVTLPDTALPVGNGAHTIVQMVGSSGSLVEVRRVDEGPPQQVVVDPAPVPPIGRPGVSAAGDVVSWSLEAYGSATTGLLHVLWTGGGGSEDLLFPPTDCGNACSVEIPPCPSAFASWCGGSSPTSTVVSYYLIGNGEPYTSANDILSLGVVAVPLRCTSTTPPCPF